jgi:hypothetical protein
MKGGSLSRLNSARVEDDEFVGKVLDIELVSPAWSDIDRMEASRAN